MPVVRNVETMNCADIEKTLVELGEKASNHVLELGTNSFVNV